MDEHNIDQSDFMKLVAEFNRGNCAWGELQVKHKVNRRISPIDPTNHDKIRKKDRSDFDDYVYNLYWD